MTYKGYKADIKFDTDANTFYGEILNSAAIIHFRGNSVDELERSFREGIDDYLLVCSEEGISPERPFSGEFRVRISPDLHKRIFLQAKEDHLSINKFVIRAFKEKLENVNYDALTAEEVNKDSIYCNLSKDLQIKVTSTIDTDLDTEINTGLQNFDTLSTNNILEFPLAS